MSAAEAPFISSQDTTIESYSELDLCEKLAGSSRLPLASYKSTSNGESDGYHRKDILAYLHPRVAAYVHDQGMASLRGLPQPRTKGPWNGYLTMNRRLGQSGTKP